MKNIRAERIPYFTKEMIKRTITMPQAIEAMHDAFKVLSMEKVILPLRSQIEIEDYQSKILMMPVSTNKYFSLKTVAICEQNPKKGKPYIQATILLINVENGSPLALFDGTYLTALRTGAATGLATKLFSIPTAQIGALFGTGGQARTQLDAITAVRSLQRVWIFGRNKTKTQRFIDLHQPLYDATLCLGENLNVLQEVDVIATVTTTTYPLFELKHLKSSVHINAMGSYQPSMCEISPEILKQSRIIVDHLDSCLHEAGDLIQANVTGNDVLGEIGQFVDADNPSLQNSMTVFKSVGNAIQDLYIAKNVYLKDPNSEYEWE